VEMVIKPKNYTEETNYLNFNDTNSIVRHLESLGYTSWVADGVGGEFG